MAPKPPTAEQYAIILNGFPYLRLNLNYFYHEIPKTLPEPSISPYIEEWTEFAEEVRNMNEKVCKVGILEYGDDAPSWREFYQVANKAGVLARYTQNVCHVMGEIFESMKLGVMFADFDFATAMHPDLAKELPYDGEWHGIPPDIVMIDEKSQDLIAVGMVEEPWISRPSQKEQLEASMVNKFGPLVHQMHYLGCQYGFYTTYNETWFLYKKDQSSFYKSNALRSNEGSAYGRPSVREGFLFFAAQAKVKRGGIQCNAPFIDDLKSSESESTVVQEKHEEPDAVGKDRTRNKHKPASSGATGCVDSWDSMSVKHSFEPKKPEKAHGLWLTADEAKTTNQRKSVSSASADQTEWSVADGTSWPSADHNGFGCDRWDLSEEWKEQDTAEETEENYVVEDIQDDSEFVGNGWPEPSQKTFSW